MFKGLCEWFIIILFVTIFLNFFKIRVCNNTHRSKNSWITIDILFDSLEGARKRLLAFGGAVEVLEPQALRLTMQDYAEQILSRYQE